MAQHLLNNALATGLRDIYQNNWPAFCDLTIKCADGEIVLAPKLILAIHSEFCAALFKHEPKTHTLTVPQFDSSLVKLIIKSLIDFNDNVTDTSSFVWQFRAWSTPFVGYTPMY